MPSTLAVCKLHPVAVIPSYGSSEAIGLDLSALVVDDRGTPYRARLEPKQRMLVRTGLAFHIPNGYYGRIAPRSGLALRSGLSILAGVIDSDYRGEVKVLVLNIGDFAMSIGTGDRVAQFIMERADRLNIVEVVSLVDTERSTGGFGSTGA